MYISGHLEGQTPNLGIEEISEIIETEVDGTLFENISKLNKNKAILRAIPSLEFLVDLRMHNFSEIEEEIEANRPVIVYIELSEGIHSAKHAVVITGLDREQDLIYYNDPIFGEKSEDINSFMSNCMSPFGFFLTARAIEFIL